MKAVKTIVKILLVVALLVALLVGGYIAYLFIQYDRMPDYTPLTVLNPQEARLAAGQEYSAATFNIGFGAYDTAFSFFLDEGEMLDGTAVKGASSRGTSQDAVERNTNSIIDTLQGLNADLYLLQEVDQKADRSYGIDQTARLRSAFAGHSSTYAANLHSAFLFYPVSKPIGRMESGLLTLSRYEVGNPHRRSYPIDESFPEKFFDLDRCFSVSYLPVEGGSGDLVLINTHMSAYDEGGTIRTAQLQLLLQTMQDERDKGNYVIVGGDFNHALGDTLNAFPTGQKVPGWVVPLSEAELPEGFYLVNAANNTEVATCRSADIPYQPGVNFTAVVDGFIVSDNVNAWAQNIDAGFAASDHNPVLLHFNLAPAEPPVGEEGAEVPAEAEDPTAQAGEGEE